MNHEVESYVGELAELRRLVRTIPTHATLEEFRELSDQFWAQLTADQKELAIYNVVKLIVDGELKDKGTFRHVIYNVFGLSPSSHVTMIDCGYMQLHNRIFPEDEDIVKRYRELQPNGDSIIMYPLVRP